MQIKFRISKWIVCPLLGLLITMGTNNNLFTYIAVLLGGASLALYNAQDSLCVLLFCMSFTHIFKSAPGNTSFFVILMLFYVAWSLLRTSRFERIIGELIVFCAYFAAIHFASGMMEISQLVKFAANFLVMYIAVYTIDYDHPRDIFLIYIFGVLLASILKVSEVYPNVCFYTGEGNTFGRFTGMHADPNYYGVNLILSLCLIVIMYHRKEIPIWLTLALTGMVVWFCTLTASKMVFLMLLIPGVMFMYSNFVNRRTWLQILFIGILVALIGMVLSGKIKAFDAVLRRFTEVDDAASLTTGRSIKWGHYLEYVFSSPRVFFVGAGLNAPYSLASNGVPHNTYIDFMFNLGFIGSCGFIWCVYRIFTLHRMLISRNLMNVCLIVCILIMWLSLSELLYFDLPFHLLLGYIVWNIPMAPVDTGKKIRFIA